MCVYDFWASLAPTGQCITSLLLHNKTQGEHRRGDGKAVTVTGLGFHYENAFHKHVRETTPVKSPQHE